MARACSVAAAGKRRTRRTQIPVSRTALVSYQDWSITGALRRLILPRKGNG
jgi:hypothetical protein